MSESVEWMPNAWKLKCEITVFHHRDFLHDFHGPVGLGLGLGRLRSSCSSTEMEEMLQEKEEEEEKGEDKNSIKF